MELFKIKIKRRRRKKERKQTGKKERKHTFKTYPTSWRIFVGIHNIVEINLTLKNSFFTVKPVNSTHRSEQGLYGPVLQPCASDHARNTSVETEQRKDEPRVLGKMHRNSASRHR